MCGIVGVFTSDGRVAPEILRAMAGSIRHRGPDDDGFFVEERVGIGMRRLSIIDLAGGAQPIANEDETLQIVFNGEIYNFQEVRETLLAKGHRFRTRTDTECILHQYEEDGVECVHRLNGMFAIAIWDHARQRLFLARDRMGIKPLYYYWDGSCLVFGSEIKALLASGLVPREMDREGLWHYLTFRYVPAPTTMWKGIRKLPPGHRLILDAGGDSPKLTVERYWRIDYRDDVSPLPYDQALERFSELFLDSVKRRLVADVPVGIFLSGGLDSSAVAAAVSEVRNAALATFSVSFREGGEYSEFPFARQVAEHFGSEHTELVIGLEDFIPFLPEMVTSTDEPLADPSCVPLGLLARETVQQVKVVLSGEGADEILAGYTFDDRVATWRKVKRYQRLPRLIRSTIPEGLLSALGLKDLAERVRVRNLPLSDANLELLPHMTNYSSSREKHRLWPGAGTMQDSGEVLRRHYREAGTRDPLHQMLYVYSQDWLVEDLLMKADRMTMAASLELRVPFLDYRIVEWLATQPAELKVAPDSNGALQTKRILRDFARSRLPAEILSRPKRGFPVPLVDWLKGALGGHARARLLGPGSRSADLFASGELKDSVVLGCTGDRRAATELWHLLIFEEWARVWM